MALNNTQLFIHEDSSVLLKMSQIAAKIAFYNFEWRYVTLVIFNNIKLTGLAMFLSQYRQSVLLKMGTYIPQHRAAVLQFVLFAQESSELASMLQWLASNQYDTSGKYVIICTSIDDEKCNEREVFETLSRVYIVNVLFIKASVTNDEPKIYSYFLVSPEKCMNSDPVQLNMSLGCSNDTCFKSAFPEKFLNMYQCPFIVSTVEQPPFMHFVNDSKLPVGGDAEILNLVVNILNASLIIKTPVEGIDKYLNNNWTGSLGDVYNDRAHASMCSAPLTPGKYGNFQISFTYDSMDMVWVAGLPALKPPWEKLLYPLKIYVRTIIFTMFVGIIFINTFTKTRAWKRIIKIIKIDPPKSNLLFYSWIIFLGMPILRMPSKPSLLIVVGMWIWFSFVIRTVYQAALINVMKQQIYENSFDKFSDVIAKKNPFGGLPSLRDYYFEDNYIYDKWIVMNLTETYNTLDNMSNGSSNFILGMKKEVIFYKLLKYDGSRRLHIIPEKIINSPTVIFFKKFSFLTAPVSHILRVSIEGGFSQRLYSRYITKAKSLLRLLNTQRTEPLRVEHFMGSFAILIVGWLLSTLFFAVEVACDKLINASRHTFNM